MTPDMRKKIRIKLGLSQPQLAAVLESHTDTVSRMERTTASSRPAPARVDQLLRAYQAGFRPKGWPAEGLAGRAGRPVTKGS